MTKRSATASRILEASRKLFNAKGYTATSVTEIAASLGISQGNLTYHFPTKQALAEVGALAYSGPKTHLPEFDETCA